MISPYLLYYSVSLLGGWSVSLRSFFHHPMYRLDTLVLESGEFIVIV